MKSYFLARLPMLFYAIAWILIRAGKLLPGFHARPVNKKNTPTKLVIEAGEQGWHSIEFKEIYQSSIEFLGEDGVEKLVVDKSKPYIPQVKRILQSSHITHYLYDPRTGSQEFFKGNFQALRLAVLFARYRVVPIGYLTNYAFRLWRCQCSAVTAVSGATATLMTPKRIQPIVCFTGSIYEPRTSFLNDLAAKLESGNVKLEIMGRELGSQRFSDEEYWRRISSVRIVITTAVQAANPKNDWEWEPHLVYRYIEVLAAGSALLAPYVPGMEKYFRPGEHFISFESVEDAASQCEYYLENPDELEKIRAAGHKRASELITTQSFWVMVDIALGFEALVHA